MYNVCICMSKIPVIVLKSENKRLTCYIVPMIGSRGNNPAAPAVPAGFLCSFGESLYAAAAEETVLSVKHLCAWTRSQKGSEWGERVTGPSSSGLCRGGGLHLGKGGPRSPRTQGGRLWDTEAPAAWWEPPLCGDISGLFQWQQSAGSET